MIEPNTYNASISSAVLPRITRQDTDAAAAADFERILNAAAPAQTQATKAAEEATEGSFSFMGFLKGVIDVINPLQHIPVVSAIYRHMTGDEMHPVAKLAGDTLYGGPVGAALAVADISYEKITGQDAGETMIAAFTGGRTPGADTPDQTIMMAKSLNDTVAPAAGNTLADASGIIWDTPSPTDSRLSPPTPPLPHMAEADVKKPASHSTPPTQQGPVYLTRNDVIPTLQPLTASKVDSTAVPHPQEAPWGTSRTEVPPELIAARMMDALDKYRDMKSAGPGSMMSGIY